MHDVLDAVEWVKDNASTYWQWFNDKVAAIGGSSGGNLLLRGVGNTNADHRPDVVAGWSANVYFGIMDLDDPEQGADYYCDGALPEESGASAHCWDAVIRYISYDIATSPYLGACWQKYQAAEPIEYYSNSGPDVFIANSTAEMVSIINLEDFDGRLADLLLIGEPCPVEGDGHGREYVLNEDKWCDDHEGVLVMEDNVDFFEEYVYP